MLNSESINIYILFLHTYSMKNRSLVLIVAIVLFIGSVYVLSTPSITGFLTNTGQFTLGNEAISLQEAYINDLNLDGEPTITGVENTTKGIIIKIEIQDDNGNCDEFTSNNGTAYFCYGDSAVCHAGNAKHSVTDFAYDAGDGQWGASNEFCNLTGSATDFYFYEVNGTWTINMTVTDGTSTDEWDDAMWDWNEIRSITYPASGSTIDMGALNSSSWNNATGYNLMQNSGNIILELDWNASDFAGTTWSDPVAIDGTNYKMDDDSDYDSDTGNLGISAIDNTPSNVIAFEGPTGLLNCSTSVCTGTNATLDIYWYLELPYGLHDDTYTNSIYVTVDDWTAYRVPGSGGGGGGGGGQQEQ